MKKLVLFFAAAVAISFASCGSKTAQTEEAPATDEVVVVEEATPATEEATPVAEEVAAEAAPEAAPAE